MNMRNQYPCLVLILAISLMAGCGKVDASSKGGIQGEFAVTSFREGKHVNDRGLYLVKNSKITKISDRGARPKWSHDGNRILAADKNLDKLYIYKKDGIPLDTINASYEVKGYDWVPGENKFIYSSSEKLNDNWDQLDRLYIYDLDTHTEKEIYQCPQNQLVLIMFVSPDGSKLAFRGIPDLGKEKDTPELIGVLNLKTGEMRKYYTTGGLLGWFPDGKHIMIVTNIKEDRTKFNNRYGIFGKINIETSALEIIKPRPFYSESDSLSQDGKYVCYIRAVEDGGNAVFVYSLESGEETQITTPVLINDRVTYSQDFDVSWYQGE